MKNYKSYLLPVILGLIVLLGSLWIGRYKLMILHLRQKYSNQDFEEGLRKHKKTILEDQAALGKYDLFKPSRGTKDAGPYLNHKIHWEIGEIHHRGSLVLPDFIKRELNKDWAIKKPLFKKMGLDFRWMRDLLAYDYWNPEENSPAYSPGKKYLTYSYPVPSYQDLMAWAKLRLLYGKETKDIPNAFKEVRHLIRLIWTNDYLVSSMVAVNMLKIEHQFHETLLPEEEGGWRLVPEEDIMRAKRYFYNAKGLSDIHVSDDLFKEMTSSGVGLCPMVVESLMGYLSMRDMLQNELSHEYKRMDKLVTSSQKVCRETIVHKMWKDPTWPTFLASENQDPFAYIGDHKILGQKLTWKELKENDELKIVMGYIFLTASKPNHFSTYDQE